MRATNEFFGKRPNWVLHHPEMRGNPYNQSVYTHLRGMNPYTRWKSERELARVVSNDTGLTEAACRKALAALRKCMFYIIDGEGKLVFGDQELVMGVAKVVTPVATVVTPVASTGYPGSQIGYPGSQHSHTGQGFPPYREIEILVDPIKERGTYVPLSSPEEGRPVILGADPEREEPSKKKAAPNETQKVFDHFNFMARKMGANPVVDVKDVSAFKAHTKRSLGRGLTAKDLTSMIDAFFQFDRNRNHRSPWKVFWTANVQRTLMAEGGSVRTDDPIMDWISNDFSRTGHLPWEPSFDDDFRTLVHLTGMSVAYRYPDLLANIARISAGDTALAEKMLFCAASLIDQCLHGEDDRTLRETLSCSGVQLPKDLNPKKVRKESMTLREAVLTAMRHN